MIYRFPLFATTAAETGSDGTLSFYCLVLFLPLVFFLACRTKHRDTVWSACATILMGSAQYILWRMVTGGLQPLNVENVPPNPESGRHVKLLVLLLTLVGLFVMWVIDKRFKRRRVN